MSIYHVAKNGSDKGTGTADDPFLTINKAASIAIAGDTIIVHEGTYREMVCPKNKGLSNKRRITYKAAEGEKVIIKGSEVIKNWINVEGNVWKAVIPNTLFGDYNPYEKTIFGDWVVSTDKVRHLGDVYLNGMSFYEVESYNELINPSCKETVLDNATNKYVPVHNIEQTKYVWYVEVNDNDTIIYANFHDYNPNEELVEINVRKACFYPEETGIDYITVSGFEMAHAATPWAPPTAEQPGLIGTHWSKGWIIENNIIHDSKCSAVSLGKEKSTGHHYHSIRKDKPGYQYQLESVFSALRIGWSKEKIGSHIVRNNTIYDCGQNAIVGHLGCIFSEIYNNHIYNIALKREFYGHEIAGIKLHAAIDVQIYNNHIHDCSLGIWLDWETQGTRVSKNLLYNNNRDLFIEVSHGPYLVDHNIFASDYCLDNISQGGAFINNLFAGKMVSKNVLDRSTPYHLPHSTSVKGFALIYGGDDRFYNNIFINKGNLEGVGTNHFDEYPSSLEEYINLVNQADGDGDHEHYDRVKQPVYINNNVYLNGAKAYSKEIKNYIDGDFNSNFSIENIDGSIYLNCMLPDDFDTFKVDIHSTSTLIRTRIVDAEYEQPNGEQIILDRDFFNEIKSGQSVPGPINKLKSGINKIKLL